jgi:hypothetical protein
MIDEVGRFVDGPVSGDLASGERASGDVAYGTLVAALGSVTDAVVKERVGPPAGWP